MSNLAIQTQKKMAEFERQWWVKLEVLAEANDICGFYAAYAEYLESYGHRYLFKVKGDKHSVTKVKKLASVDVEKINSVKAFVESVVTENRVDQAISSACNGGIDITRLGDVIKWVFNDVVKEESDTMEANGIAHKDIGGPIAQSTKKIFFEKMKEFSNV